MVVGSSCSSSFFVSVGATGSTGSSTFSAVSSAIRCQPFRSARMSVFPQQFHRALRRPLLGLFLCAALAAGHAFALDPNFHLKNLLMVRPAFGRQPVFSRRLPLSLQKFLESRLAVRIRDALAALLE